MKRKRKIRPCNLCGRKRQELVLVKFGNKMVKCSYCGLVFVNPQPSLAEIKKFYEEHYYNIEDFPFLSKETSGYRDCVGSKKVIDKYFSDKLSLIQKHKKNGVILDVGSSLGFFLNLAQKRGWKTKGVEISKYAALYAKEHFGLDISFGELEKAEYENNCFDAVCIFQTIEHLSDPAKTLKEIHRILKPSGIVIITTPNIKSLYTRLLGKRSFQYKHQEHLYYFTPQTLTLLLEKTSFKNISIARDAKWPISLEEIVERAIHFYPEMSFLLKPIFIMTKKSRLADMKTPIPYGDMCAFAFKQKCL